MDQTLSLDLVPSEGQVAVGCTCRYLAWKLIDSGLVGGGTTRAEDAQGTPTQSHILPSILVYEDYSSMGFDPYREEGRAPSVPWMWSTAGRVPIQYQGSEVASRFSTRVQRSRPESVPGFMGRVPI